MEAKLLLKDGVLKNISTFIERNKLNNCIYESVEWDLLTAMMEYAYSTYVKPGFHTELLEIYNSGHIPCGWKGKYFKEAYWYSNSLWEDFNTKRLLIRGSDNIGYK